MPKIQKNYRENNPDLNILRFFERPFERELEIIDFTRFTNVQELMEDHFVKTKQAFNQIAKLHQRAFLFGREMFHWKPCNYDALIMHLRPVRGHCFGSSSIVKYHVPLLEWRMSFILLNKIFLNRFSSVFFVGDHLMGRLSGVLSKFNAMHRDHFFQSVDYWFGGLISNLQTLQSMPNVDLDFRYSAYKQSGKRKFYIRTFRRPSCVIVLRYSGNASHADKELGRYLIPSIGLTDTDSSVGGISKILYTIRTSIFNRNMLYWYLSVFMFIIRHCRYKRLQREINLLNPTPLQLSNSKFINERSGFTSSVSLFESKPLDYYGLETHYMRKGTEVFKLERLLFQSRLEAKTTRYESYRFLNIVKYFTQVISIVMLALSIRGHGLINYYYKTLFLFKEKKFTKVLKTIAFVFEKLIKKVVHPLDENKPFLYNNIQVIKPIKNIYTLFTRKEWLPRILKIHKTDKQQVHLAFTNKYFNKVLGCLEPIVKGKLERWRAGNRNAAKIRKYNEQLRKFPNKKDKIIKPVMERYIPIPPATRLFAVSKKNKQLIIGKGSRFVTGDVNNKLFIQLFRNLKIHWGIINQLHKKIQFKASSKTRIASAIGKLNIVFSLLSLPKTVAKYQSRYALHMRQLANVTKQRFFEYKLDRKLKAIKIHRRQSLEGLFIPRRVINTKVWRRLTVDQLMRKRKESLQLVNTNNKFNRSTNRPMYHKKGQFNLSPLPVYANRRYDRNYIAPKKSIRLRLQKALTMNMSSSEQWTYNQNYKKNFKKATKAKLENKIVKAILTKSKKNVRYLASKYKKNYNKKVTEIPDFKFKIQLARSVLKYRAKCAARLLKTKSKNGLKVKSKADIKQVPNLSSLTNKKQKLENNYTKPVSLPKKQKK